jgi:hypothetical protein
MNKMMLKVIADFLGLEPEEIRKMLLDGHSAIADGLKYMEAVNLKLTLIMDHLGIHPNENTDGRIIEHAEIESAE